MLRDNPTPLPDGPGKVCVVATGPECLSVAETLHEAGRRVHVLYGGTDAIGAAWRCRRAGLEFSKLDDWGADDAVVVLDLFGWTRVDDSDRVLWALMRMARVTPLAVVVFPSEWGLGFRTIQAKRAGLGFKDVSLVVRLDGCGPWRREQEQCWPSDLEDLAIDFAERFAFEHADVQLVPDPLVREYVCRLGWSVWDDARSDVVEASAEAEQGPKWNPAASDLPLVTVVVPHHNLGNHLPETLQSLAAQTYPNLEVLVIDDGSTDSGSLATLEEMNIRHPDFRFLCQANAGIGATRNRGLAEAHGEFFIPVDADNVARPDMVQRFVEAMQRSPELAAMSCYFLAFEKGDPLQQGRYAYAYRPTGGPHTLASIRNVYGDGNAVFRTAVLRAVEGFETDRGTSFEDWEVFVKLVNAGQAVGVVPEPLFYYRHRSNGFSRVTNSYSNHQRVLRQFIRQDRLPAGESTVLWLALHGFQRRVEVLTARQRRLPYRVADGVEWFLRNGVVGHVLRSARRIWHRIAG